MQENVACSGWNQLECMVFQPVKGEHYLPCVGMGTCAHLVRSLIHVTAALGQGVEDDQVKVHLLLAVAVLRRQAVCSSVGVLGVVDHECGRRATLILLVEHGEVLVGRQIAEVRMCPCEGWWRLCNSGGCIFETAAICRPAAEYFTNLLCTESAIWMTCWCELF